MVFDSEHLLQSLVLMKNAKYFLFAGTGEGVGVIRIFVFVENFGVCCRMLALDGDT